MPLPNTRMSIYVVLPGVRTYVPLHVFASTEPRYDPENALGQLSASGPQQAVSSRPRPPSRRYRAHATAMTNYLNMQRASAPMAHARLEVAPTVGLRVAVQARVEFCGISHVDDMLCAPSAVFHKSWAYNPPPSRWRNNIPTRREPARILECPGFLDSR